MAQIDRDIGVPTVAPEARPPDDYIRLDVRPEAFGAGKARGVQELGQGITRASENAFDLTKHYEDVATDDQINKVMSARDKLMHGDPNNPDDHGYMGLQGRAALDARKSTEENLDKLISDARGNLGSQYQRQAFDVQTRRLRSYWSNEIGTHADTQFQSWTHAVNDAGAANAKSGIASNADNPAVVRANTADLINFRVKAAQARFGNDPAILQTAAENARAEAVQTQLETIGASEPARALKMLEKNKSVVGDSYATIYNSLRARADQQEGVQAGASAIDEAHKAVQSVPADSVKHAIVQQESGGNPNAATSVTGATGPGQVQPATFQQYAKPGEDINNPQHNLAVSGRIVDDYYQRYGGDPRRIAVAYFSGPGNVAPPGNPTPWLVDKADPTGKTTSSYVNDVALRLGIPGGPAGMKANAYKAVMERTDLSQPAKQHALQYINQTYTAAQVASEADAKARKEANDGAMNSYVTGMINKGAATPADIAAIANDPNLTPETKENLYNFATQKFGFEATAQFGPDYADTYQRIFLSAGDPNRISDPNEILKLGNPAVGGLTLSGVDRLFRIYQSSMKNPDQAAVNSSKASLIQYAKSKLSFDQEMLFPGMKPLSDPKGAQVFNSAFVPKFEAAYDKWIKDGKSPFEFLTKDNVDKLMTGLRSPAEMAAAKLNATGEVAPEDKNAPAPPAPQGVNPDAWSLLISVPPKTESGQPLRRDIWGRALESLLKSPTPENIKAFDESGFGRAGFKAQEIIDNLAPKKPEAKKEEPKAETPAESPGIFGRIRQGVAGFVERNRQDLLTMENIQPGVPPQ